MEFPGKDLVVQASITHSLSTIAILQQASKRYQNTVYNDWAIVFTIFSNTTQFLREQSAGSF